MHFICNKHVKPLLANADSSHTGWRWAVWLHVLKFYFSFLTCSNLSAACLYFATAPQSFTMPFSRLVGGWLRDSQILLVRSLTWKGKHGGVLLPRSLNYIPVRFSCSFKRLFSISISSCLVIFKVPVSSPSGVDRQTDMKAKRNVWMDRQCAMWWWGAVDKPLLHVSHAMYPIFAFILTWARTGEDEKQPIDMRSTKKFTINDTKDNVKLSSLAQRVVNRFLFYIV